MQADMTAHRLRIVPERCSRGKESFPRTRNYALKTRCPPSHPGLIGEIDASSRVVQEALDDIESYPSFTPYTTECRLLKREADSVIAYQRFSPRICCDRDYTLRVYRASRPVADGLVYSSRWESANDLGPAKKLGVVRVGVCEGTWLLEPDSANKTRATYSIYTDTGGLVPSFLANHFSQVAIAKLFVAIRQQVKQPKYNVAVR